VFQKCDVGLLSIAGVGFSSPTTEEKDENIPPAAEQLSCRFLFSSPPSFTHQTSAILKTILGMPSGNGFPGMAGGYPLFRSILKGGSLCIWLL
jgi:hypothetical protein